MMGKNPAFQFYPSDWSRDLEEHPLEIEGAWIRICCKLWWSETRGSLTRTPEQWAKILRVDLEHSNQIIFYINSWKIGEIYYDPNGNITVESRRMLREEKDRLGRNLRQKRHYTKKQPNAQPNANLTSPSSVLHSSSSNKKNKHSGFCPPVFEDVFAYCKERKNTVNPRTFLDHYSSNGWMVGKNKMKDWKAAVRTWEARGGNDGRRPGHGGGGPGLQTTPPEWKPDTPISPEQRAANLQRLKALTGGADPPEAA